MEFQERTRKILKALVQDYIRTAEPVSSKALATSYSLGVSPATIRSVMAELESLGYLVQPHTSAGRVPTEKSFRFYVDSLLDLEEPGQDAKDLLGRICERTSAIDDVLSNTAKVLSAMTNCAGVLFIPRKESFTIKHISLFPIDATGVMVLLVSDCGMVHSRVVPVTGIEKLELEKVTNYLNSLGAGLTIGELRSRIVEEMTRDKNLYNELMARALRLGAAALEDSGGGEKDVLVEGKVKVLEQPEFRDDFERMKTLFSAFEEKSLLVKILDRSLDGGGPRIYLGSENDIKEFTGLSFVTAPYGRNGEVLGTLGVVGPVRMDYSRIIPLVDYTSGLLSRVF